ncbi:hypothetical protein ACE1CI_38315 [Aerosakkonemataceae cyanobacterium BLCC-F50]|uniref:DUF937 domain-containing protein n=1 Tax=Floridaenema flaviceps BLCC-F50 TaxID=3153642 RepID=A0ABV4Y508_9CYAN
MGLFFEILSSLNNPHQQGSVSQLEYFLNTVNQLSANRGVNPSQMQKVMSTLGSLLRPVLKQQSLAGGGFESRMNHVIGANGNVATLPSLIPPQVQQQMVEKIAQTSELSTTQIETALPILISGVISLLNMGASKPGIQGGENQILNAFLNAEKDSDVDLGEVMKFASRLLHPYQAA